MRNLIILAMLLIGTLSQAQSRDLYADGWKSDTSKINFYKKVVITSSQLNSLVYRETIRLEKKKVDNPYSKAKINVFQAINEKDIKIVDDD